MGLFDVYQENRDQGVASLITPDLLLVSYSLLRQQLNQQTESKIIIPEFKFLISGLHDKAAANKGDVVGKLGHDYLVLLDAMQLGSLSPKASPTLQKEWDLVHQAAGVAISPLWGITLDYSQFKPRGRYTLSKDLEHFFVAYRYASTVNFFIQSSLATGVSPEKAKQLTQLAVHLSKLIENNAALKSHFDSLNQAWEYGVAGDLSVSDVSLALKDVKNVDEYGAALLNYARQNGKLPQVIDFPVDTNKLTAQEKLAEVAAGWRLISGTLNVDSMATQAVLYPNTQQFISPCGTIDCGQPWSASQLDGRLAKGYVSGMEVMAWLGSDTARYISQRNGDSAYSGYAQAAQQGQKLLNGGQYLGGAQMQFMRTVLGQKTTASTRQLTGMLGFWTWQRNINALYAKQPSAVGSKSLSANKPTLQRKGAQLLGGAAFYQALGQLTQQHQARADGAVWQQFAEIVGQLAVLSEKTALSIEDEDYLNELDLRLLSLTKVKDQPIVIDVQTNPADKLVVEEAIGLPDVEQRGEARGAWLTHFEFKRAMSARLTHEEWRKQLKRGE
jgi:hypothetical protein